MTLGSFDAYVGAPGAAARGRTQFHSGILIQKKGATHNDKAPRIRQGAAREPPGITLSGSMAPEMLLIKINGRNQNGRDMGNKRV